MKRESEKTYKPFYEQFACLPLFTWAKCEFCDYEFRFERGMGFRIQLRGDNKYACAACCKMDHRVLDELIKSKFFTHGMSGRRTLHIHMSKGEQQ